MTYDALLKKNNVQEGDLPAKIRKMITAYGKAEGMINGIDESTLSAKDKKELAKNKEALVEMDGEIVEQIEIWLEKPAEVREAMRQKGLNLAKGRAKNSNGAAAPAAAAGDGASAAATTPATATPAAAEPAKAAAGASTASAQNGTPAAAAATSTVPASAAPGTNTTAKKANGWLVFGIVVSVAFALVGIGVYQSQKNSV
jgi:hypothetical protein